MTNQFKSNLSSKYNQGLNSNIEDFGIVYQQVNNNLFAPTGYTCKDNIIKPFYLPTLNNRLFTIVKAEISTNIIYNWTEYDFIRVKGQTNGLVYAYDKIIGDVKFRSDLNPLDLVNGLLSDYSPSTSRITTLTTLVVPLNAYFTSLSIDLKLVNENGRFLFSTASNTNYTLEISRPLQCLLFGTQLEYNGEIYNEFDIVNRYLLLSPSYDRLIALEITDDNSIIFRATDISSNTLAIDKRLSNSNNLVNIVQDNIYLKFIYFNDVSIEQSLSNLTINNNFYQNVMLLDDKPYGADRSYIYFDNLDEYYNNICNRSITIFFRETIN